MIEKDTLRLAEQHEDYCLFASQELDNIAHRAEIRNQADSILARIRTAHGTRIEGEWLLMSRSQLTTHFAANPGRSGSLKPDELYQRIIPDLMKRGLARLHEKNGKLEVFAFLRDPDGVGGGTLKMQNLPNGA